jgi:hypothetical protein
MGKGGGSTTSTGTTYTSSLPEYARPYYERLAQRTEAESKREYTPYEAQRIAAFDPDTLQSFQSVRDIAGAGTPGIDAAQQTAADVAAYQSGYAPGAGAQGLADYQSAYAAGAGPDAEQYQSVDWTGADRQAYMDPYVQNVLRQQEQIAQRRFGEQEAARQAAAVQAGAFGGDRRFVQESLAQRDINEQLNLMQAQGLSQAYQRAQETFAADQERQAEAAGIRLSGYQARQQAAQTEEAARAAAAGMRLEDYRAQQQAQQAAESARQAASGIRLAGAKQQAGLDVARQQQGLQQAEALQRIGAQQEAKTQQGLDLVYQDFINQRDFPRQQLAFFSQILQGMPVTPQQEVTTYSPSPNPLSQALGLGVGGYSLMNLLGAQ